jgi:lysine 2,3-aminomutase
VSNDYETNINNLQGLTPSEPAALKKVTEKYPFFAHRYYLSLIDWDDPNDPIRRAVVPSVLELEEWGRRDASGEKTYTVMPGMQHKYTPTALLLVSNACAAICRYCFRKRIFMSEPEEVLEDLPAALDYIREHTEINNVLLTGGDPLMLPTAELEHIIKISAQ